MRELIVFDSERYARLAGFGHGGAPATRHFHDPDLHAWWPGLGEQALRGVEYARIIITQGAFRVCSAEVHGRIEAALRSRLRLGAQTWMEL